MFDTLKEFKCQRVKGEAGSRCKKKGIGSWKSFWGQSSFKVNSKSRNQDLAFIFQIYKTRSEYFDTFWINYYYVLWRLERRLCWLTSVQPTLKRLATPGDFGSTLVGLNRMERSYLQLACLMNTPTPIWSRSYSIWSVGRGLQRLIRETHGNHCEPCFGRILEQCCGVRLPRQIQVQLTAPVTN